MAATIYTANSSSITVTPTDGSPSNIEGVQGIDYRFIRQQGEVFALGSDERLATYYGPSRVQGKIHVTSTDPTLDSLTTTGKEFVLAANLGHSEPLRSVAFQNCFMKHKEFSMASGGVGDTVYHFSATKVLEEPPAS
jgi:hypothetical protein